MDYDVIAATHLFTNANDARLNDVTLAFPLANAGATFAFREQVNTIRDNNAEILTRSCQRWRLQKIFQRGKTYSPAFLIRACNMTCAC